MTPTMRLLLSLLFSGGVGATLVNGEPKKNILEMQAQLEELGRLQVSNPHSPLSPGLPPLNNTVSINPQIPSINSSTIGTVAASEESVEEKHRNGNHRNGRRQRTWSGSHENHYTGSLSDENKRYLGKSRSGSSSLEGHTDHGRHRPESAKVSYRSRCHSDEKKENSERCRPASEYFSYHDTHSAEGKEYPRRYRMGSGKLIDHRGSHSVEDSLTRTKRSKPSVVRIHYNTAPVREVQKSSEGSTDNSRSATLEESPAFRQHRYRKFNSRSRRNRRRRGRHHDSSSNLYE